MKSSEHAEQKALFQWLALNARKDPDLALTFAIPNGGHRHIVVAAKLKAEGVRAGVPDVFLPVSRGDKHGIFIELKHGKNKLTPEQVWWQKRLLASGYQVVTAYGWEQAAWAILDYLEN
jgi:hypothetical protein